MQNVNIGALYPKIPKAAIVKLLVNIYSCIFRGTDFVVKIACFQWDGIWG
jgi:hypothetical protein